MKTGKLGLILCAAMLMSSPAFTQDFFADYVYLSPAKGDLAWLDWPLPAAELRALAAEAPSAMPAAGALAVADTAAAGAAGLPLRKMAMPSTRPMTSSSRPNSTGHSTPW